MSEFAQLSTEYLETVQADTLVHEIKCKFEQYPDRVQHISFLDENREVQGLQFGFGAVIKDTLLSDGRWRRRSVDRVGHPHDGDTMLNPLQRSILIARIRMGDQYKS